MLNIKKFEIMKNKFKINDVVNHPPDLYGETESTVEKTERIFRCPNGRASDIIESDLDSIRPDLNPRIENIDGV